MQTPQDKLRQLQSRLLSVEQILVNPIYQEFVEMLKEKRDSTLQTVLSSTVSDISEFFIREQAIGGAGELTEISNWFTNEKQGLEQQIEQLTEKDK